MKRLLIPPLALLAVSAAAADTELRIELSTCTADGMYNSLKEKYDKKAFWVGQNVVLEMALEQYRGTSAAEECSHITDAKDKMACASYWVNRRAAIIRCYQTSKQMCRLHGGQC